MEKLAFQPFDPLRATKIYYNNLPHWRQEGATYFVTFRLADSIPLTVQSEWEYEKRIWLEQRHGIEMDRDGLWRRSFLELPEDAQSAFRSAFDRKRERFLDSGYGACQFREREAADCFFEKAETFDGVRYDLGDCVVMPNHVHLLITPKNEHRLEEILRGIKGTSAFSVNCRNASKGKLWQKDSYDHIVRDGRHLRKFQSYIHQNPKVAGIPSDKWFIRTAEYDV